MSHAVLGQFNSDVEYKCSLCLSRNPKTAAQCRSCSHPYEGYDANAAKSTTAAVAAPVASTGGFIFGAASDAPAASTGGFTFGNFSTTPAASTGGFTFGAPATGDAAAPAVVGGFVFGNTSVPAAVPATTTTTTTTTATTSSAIPSTAVIGEFNPDVEYKCSLCFCRNPKTEPQCRSCSQPYNGQSSMKKAVLPSAPIAPILKVQGPVPGKEVKGAKVTAKKEEEKQDDDEEDEEEEDEEEQGDEEQGDEEQGDEEEAEEDEEEKPTAKSKKAAKKPSAVATKKLTAAEKKAAAAAEKKLTPAQQKKADAVEKKAAAAAPKKLTAAEKKAAAAAEKNAAPKKLTAAEKKAAAAAEKKLTPAQQKKADAVEKKAAAAAEKKLTPAQQKKAAVAAEKKSKKNIKMDDEEAEDEEAEDEDDDDEEEEEDEDDDDEEEETEEADDEGLKGPQRRGRPLKPDEEKATKVSKTKEAKLTKAAATKAAKEAKVAAKVPKVTKAAAAKAAKEAKAAAKALVKKATTTKKATRVTKKSKAAMADEDNEDQEGDDEDQEDEDDEEEEEEEEEEEISPKTKMVKKNQVIYDVSLDESHSLALLSTEPMPILSRPAYGGKGQVYSFGAGDCAQLGLGYSEDDSLRTRRFPTPLKAFGELNIVAIAAGSLHNLALTDKGHVYSWGCNDDGALGRTLANQRQEFTPERVLGLLEDEVIVGIGAGSSHSVALAASGKVYSWGSYRDGGGLIGFDEKNIKCFSPVLVPGLEKKFITQIVCGESHSLALTRDGDVYYWGDVFVGRRQSDRRKVARLQPQMLAFRAPPSVLSLYEWPNSEVKQTTGAYKLTREDVNIAFVAAGGYTSMAISRSGIVWVWGPNNYTQTGIDRSFGKGGDVEKPKDETPAILYPTMIPYFVDNGLKVIAATCANQYSLFLTDDRRVWGVGRFSEGRIGQEKDFNQYTSIDQQSIPLEIKTLSPKSLSSPASWQQPLSSAVTTKTHDYFVDPRDDCVVGMHCSDAHAMLVTNQGRVFGFGIGDCFQMGNGLAETRFGPYWIRSNQIATIPRIAIGVGCGSQHSLILAKDAVLE